MSEQVEYDLIVISSGPAGEKAAVHAAYQGLKVAVIEKQPVLGGGGVNAGWHRTQRLEWHHIEKVFLPPYSLDMNPIERLWQYLKSHGMAGYFTGGGKELGNKLRQSIQELLDQPHVFKRKHF